MKFNKFEKNKIKLKNKVCFIHPCNIDKIVKTPKKSCSA